MSLPFASGSTSKRDRTLAQPVTYRHLHSANSLNASNPLRVIALCDIDAAYAQFEMVRLGLDKDIPCAVQQWSGLIAISYPARAFGISRHETVDEAKKKCPDLVCVHVATYREGDAEPGYHPDATHQTHKVSLDPYRKESLKILKIFGEMCPTIQKASIDEAYLDFTLPVRTILLERYPVLAQIPESGLDTPLPFAPDFAFDGLGHLIPVEEGQVSWSDVAIGIGAELMQKCREAVKDRLGYTCSAGIAKNKSLAKLCAGFNKPDAQTVLRPSAVAGFLRPMQFQKIRFLGGKLGASIAAEYDAATVGDLWTVSLDEMQQKYGEEAGLWVWEIIRGIDFAEVENKTQVKSMVSSKNFKPAITTWEEARHWLTMMAAELCHRLTEARELSPGLWPKTLALHHRSENYVTKTRQAPFPFTSNLTAEGILKLGEKILRDFIGERKAGQNTELGGCTNLSLQFQSLERQESGQRGIEGFFAGGRVSPTKAGKRKAEPPDLLLVDDGDLPQPSKKSKTPRPIPVEESKSTTSKVKFTCPKCSKLIETVFTHDPAEDVKTLKADALKRLKDEHADFHFARDLMQDQRIIVGGSSRNKSKKSKSAPDKHPESKARKKTDSVDQKPKMKGTLAGFFGK